MFWDCRDDEVEVDSDGEEVQEDDEGLLRCVFIMNMENGDVGVCEWLWKCDPRLSLPWSWAEIRVAAGSDNVLEALETMVLTSQGML